MTSCNNSRTVRCIVVFLLFLVVAAAPSPSVRGGQDVPFRRAMQTMTGSWT